MNLVLTLIEQWGIYLIAGVLVIYFGWTILAYLRTQPLIFKNDPIVMTTTLGWGSVWVVGNGIGNTLFLFAIATMTGEIVVYHTGAFEIPVIPGIETLIFVMGLMPSLYQFRYQADPGYLETLTVTRRGVALGMTIADGVCCALGWYWWLLPPVFTNGHFDFPYDRSLVTGVFAWSLFSSYLAQYMAHMQLYDLLGLRAPVLPNPFAPIWQAVLAHLGKTGMPRDEAQEGGRHLRHPDSRKHPRSAKTHRPYTPSNDTPTGISFDDGEAQA